ncbi:MAG TPA: DUF1622 domain-containing protein [Salinimicrobium sp.]|nr:DUF1622 domain-containing protein [Salinimicrobium sp.]
MDENLIYYTEIAAKIFEVAGILTMVFGAVLSLVRYAIFKIPEPRSFKNLRQELGKSILLGLEFLVAADIIATVGIDPSMDQVLVLGLIVLIRTFLSFSLEVELEGKFPWQKKQ